MKGRGANSNNQYITKFYNFILLIDYFTYMYKSNSQASKTIFYLLYKSKKFIPPNMEEYRIRSVKIPFNKIAYFKENWLLIYTPLVDTFDLQIRFNLQTSSIDLKTKNTTNLEKCAHFLTALLVFPLSNAIFLLKRGNVFTDSFEIRDVKRLKHQHINRAIGRIIGREGKVKKSIEQASNTKIVVMGETIHIMGSVDNMKLARDAVCRLIMGSEPGKVCSGIRNVTEKIKDRIGMIENIRERLE